MPIVSLEPKWYDNSQKRQYNSKNTFHNSSNLAALIVRYYPELFAISPDEINELDGGIFFIPDWSLRRNISYRLNYELGIGRGIDVYEFLTNKNGTTNFLFKIHLRIGATSLEEVPFKNISRDNF